MKKATIEPGMSLELRLRWLEAIVYGVKERKERIGETNESTTKVLLLAVGFNSTFTYLYPPTPSFLSSTSSQTKVYYLILPTNNNIHYSSAIMAKDPPTPGRAGDRGRGHGQGNPPEGREEPARGREGKGKGGGQPGSTPSITYMPFSFYVS